MTRGEPLSRELRRDLLLSALEAERFEERVAWAVRALELGADTEHLRVLASLSLEKHPSPRGVDRLFARCLDELGLPALTREERLRQVLRAYAERYLDGAVDAPTLLGRASRVWVELGYPDEEYGLALCVEVDLALGASLEEMEPKVCAAARRYVRATPDRLP